METSETFPMEASSNKDKESVKVVVRCRPLFGKELIEGRKSIVSLDQPAALISLKCPENSQLKSFTFDSVYDENISQRQFYDEAAYPLVESIFDGYNGTIFAYGQTGCGKTHTMQGKAFPIELRGVIPLSFDHIFDTIKADSTKEYMVRVSYLEIYNEEIRDLLHDDTKKKFDLKEAMDGTVYVKDLTEVVVRDVESMTDVMTRGFKGRTVGATLMNEGSSRSHSIFTVVVETSETIAQQDHFKAGKLNLVDLAGSERQSKTGATGNRLKEGCKINLSLSALGNVISALVDGKGKHIPYRDSKLTRLLQDSLGGNTKTLMVAAISPADYNYDETLSTLRYANRAKNIKNKPVVNEDPKDAKLREYKEEIERLRTMLESQSQSRDNDTTVALNGVPEQFERREYEQEAEEMLARAKRMMDEAQALQLQQFNHFSEEKSPLPPLLGLVDDDRETVSSSKDVAMTQAMQQAVEMDAQAKEMMAKAEKMMKEAADRTVEKIVVKEVIPEDHVKKQNELRELNQTILHERDRVGQELEKTQRAMETSMREKEVLRAKLKKIESHILGGTSSSSFSSSSKLHSIADSHEMDSEVALLRQQVDYRRAQLKLRAKVKKQAKTDALRRTLELEKQQVEDELKTAQETVQATLLAARKKETKYKGKLEASRQEIVDLYSEFERERETLCETIREQSKETKLLEQLVDLFLPSNELVKVWERAIWNEEREEWSIPRVRPRSDFQTIKLPSLPLQGSGMNTRHETGGAEVVSDAEDESRDAARGFNGSKRGISRPSTQNTQRTTPSRDSDNSLIISPSARLQSANYTSRVATQVSSFGTRETSPSIEKSSPNHHFLSTENLLQPLSDPYEPRDRLQSRQSSRQESRQDKRRQKSGPLEHTRPSVLTPGRRSRHRKERQEDEKEEEEEKETSRGLLQSSSNHSKKKKKKREKEKKDKHME